MTAHSTKTKGTGRGRATAKPPAATRRPITAADVAREAHVSRSTVSLVLNQVPDSRITDATRERVLAAADAIGYTPHAAASALRGGYSQTVLIPFLDRPNSVAINQFYDRLAGRLTELGYTVMFHRDRAASGRELVRQWASLRPVGVIVEAHRLDEASRELLHKAGTRAILSAELTDADPDVPGWMGAAGVHAAEYLIAAGHRRLGAIVPREAAYTSVGLRRLKGVEQVAQAHGVPVERIDLGLDRADASALAERWKTRPHPTGVFAHNDEYATVLMRGLQDAGIDIPADVAVIGCDNLWLCEFLRPRLTSITMHPEVGGETLAEQLHAMILDRPFVPSDPGRPTVVVRESA